MDRPLSARFRLSLGYLDNHFGKAVDGESKNKGIVIENSILMKMARLEQEPNLAPARPPF